MSRNITVTVPDELSEKMNNMIDVNWSGVTREAIEKYIKGRDLPIVAYAIEKVKEKKDADFREGYDFIIDNIDEISIPVLQEICTASRNNHEHKLMMLLDEDISEQILDIKDNDEGVADVYYTVSVNFILGMSVAAEQLLENTSDDIPKEFVKVSLGK